MNIRAPHPPLRSIGETPSLSLRDSALAKNLLKNDISRPTQPVKQTQRPEILLSDVYRSMAIGAGLGSGSGIISGIMNKSHTVEQGGAIGAAAGALNGAVVGAITIKNSSSRNSAMAYPALASAGIAVTQSLMLGKNTPKQLAVGLVSGAMRGAVVSYQLHDRGMQRAANQQL